MSYDLYETNPSGDVVTTLRLLAGREDSANAVKKFVELVHGRSSKYDQFIDGEMKTIGSLGLLPSHPDMAALPPGSWFLQFTFTLAKPWISKDDDPFYVAESVNPVRKDKVFKAPMMSAASWKGLLRWTLMHTRLTLKKDSLTPERFAQERFVQTLLFGDEQGEEPGQVKGFADYVNLLKPEARSEYERLLRQYYDVKQNEPLLHHSGRLMFYPTFFDGIDVEVINPHSRQTKAGTHPIYLESVPAGAKGTFSLLYVPFDRVGKDEAETRREIFDDLQRVAEGLQALFTVYGFSAKRSSGFGVAADRVHDGTLVLGGMEYESDSFAAEAPSTSPPKPDLARYLSAPNRLHPDFASETGELKSEAEYQKIVEGRGQKYAKKDKQLYDKAKSWWEREGQQLAQQADEPETEPEPIVEAPPPYPLARETFTTFAELPAAAQKLCDALRQTGGAA